MKDHTIPAGYILEITTWENDGDAYMTDRKEGLTKEQVKLYLDICRGFDAGYDGESFGNYDGPRNEVEEFVKETCAKHGVEYNEDLPCDLIGRWNDGQFYRVFEDARLYYVDAPVVMVQLDTDKF